MAVTTSTNDVELRAVTKRFDDVIAVDSIDLFVRKGEFLSLLGPSGCGKTTTLRLIAGFEQPDEGEILIAGEEVAGLPPYKRDVNTVFQSYALFPHLTVLHNVAYGLKQRGLRRPAREEKAREALALVRLEQLERRKPRQLSGGQQQRVAAARALVSRPEIVFADEPTGNLDSRASQELLTFLKAAVTDRGQTIVMVTHDPVGASYANRIVFLADGQIVDEMRDPTAERVLDRMKSLEA